MLIVKEQMKFQIPGRIISITGEIDEQRFESSIIYFDWKTSRYDDVGLGETRFQVGKNYLQRKTNGKGLVHEMDFWIFHVLGLVVVVSEFLLRYGWGRLRKWNKWKLFFTELFNLLGRFSILLWTPLVNTPEGWIQ